MPNEEKPERNEIGKLLDEIIAAKKLINTSWDDVPFNVREGWGIGRRNAEEAVQTLTKKIQKLSIPKRLIGLYATGDLKALTAMRKLMGKEGGLVINANKIYLDIAKDLEPTYGTDRLFKINTFMQLVTLYRNLAEDFDIINCPPLNYYETNCPKFNDTVEYVKKQIKDVLGNELTIKVLTKDLVDGIIKDELDERYIPVMVIETNAEDKRFLTRFFTKTIDLFLTDPEEVTKENVTKYIKTALT